MNKLLCSIIIMPLLLSAVTSLAASKSASKSKYTQEIPLAFLELLPAIVANKYTGVSIDFHYPDSIKLAVSRLPGRVDAANSPKCTLHIRKGKITQITADTITQEEFVNVLVYKPSFNGAFSDIMAEEQYDFLKLFCNDREEILSQYRKFIAGSNKNEISKLIGLLKSLNIELSYNYSDIKLGQRKSPRVIVSSSSIEDDFDVFLANSEYDLNVPRHLKKGLMDTLGLGGAEIAKEKPVEEKAAEEKAVEEKAAEEKAVEEEAAEEKAVEEKAAEEGPVEEESGEKESVEEEPIKEESDEEAVKKALEEAVKKFDSELTKIFQYIVTQASTNVTPIKIERYFQKIIETCNGPKEKKKTIFSFRGK